MFVHKIRVKRLYLGVKLKSVQSTFAYSAQGWINHWANRANAQGLAFLGLNTKTLLCWLKQFERPQLFHLNTDMVIRRGFIAFWWLCREVLLYFARLMEEFARPFRSLKTHWKTLSGTVANRPYFEARIWPEITIPNLARARHLFLKSGLGPKTKFAEWVKICPTVGYLKT